MIAERKNTVELRLINDKEPTLEEMQEYVAGNIELVYLPNGDHLIINEDGIRLGLPVNQEASVLANIQILGSALVLKDKARLT